MRLGTKIFFYIIIFFSAAFLFGGYILLSYFYEVNMNREISSAVERYQYNKFVLQANLITRGTEWFQGAADGSYDMRNIVSDMNDTVALFSMDREVLYSGFPSNGGAVSLEKGAGMMEEESESGDFPESGDNTLAVMWNLLGMLDTTLTDRVEYQFTVINGRTYLLTAGVVKHGQTGIYLVTGADVQRVSEQQEQIVGKFGAVYSVTMVVGAILIFGLSNVLTKPVKELTEATRKIADGNYKERVADKGVDEVGQLARNFNRMAHAVEEKIQELSDSAKQKEDFVANFAHELKTPLTSVIGYADRIYRKELPREAQKQAAWHIWNEGMRLEALSLKLMDLASLDHGTFTREEVQADILLGELAADLDYMMEKHGVSFVCSAQEAYIAVEYDLFKTLMLNLADNAVKAGAKHIEMWGRVECEKPGGSSQAEPADGQDTQAYYRILLCDDGSGIPEEEIRRITEAFYMVDKSRSRKQHGAGLGLALAEKIAQIHESTLVFESDGCSGTTVSISLKCRGSGVDCV